MGLDDLAREHVSGGQVDSVPLLRIAVPDRHLARMLREIGVPVHHSGWLRAPFFEADPTQASRLLKVLNYELVTGPNGGVYAEKLEAPEQDPSRRQFALGQVPASVVGVVLGTTSLGTLLSACLGSPQTNRTGGGSTKQDMFAYDPKNGLGPIVHDFNLFSSDPKNDEPEHPYTAVQLLLRGTSMHTHEITVDGQKHQLSPGGTYEYYVRIPGHWSPTIQHSFLVNLVDAGGYTRIAGQIYGKPHVQSTIPNAYLKPRLAGTFIGGSAIQDDESFKSGTASCVLRFGARPNDIIDISRPFKDHNEIDLEKAPKQQPILLQISTTGTFMRTDGKTIIKVFRCVMPLDLSRTVG